MLAGMLILFVNTYIQDVFSGILGHRFVVGDIPAVTIVRNKLDNISDFQALHLLEGLLVHLFVFKTPTETKLLG
jgi:hypothetical protein